MPVLALDMLDIMFGPADAMFAPYLRFFPIAAPFEPIPPDFHAITGAYIWTMRLPFAGERRVEPMLEAVNTHDDVAQVAYRREDSSLLVFVAFFVPKNEGQFKTILEWADRLEEEGLVTDRVRRYKDRPPANIRLN